MADCLQESDDKFSREDEQEDDGTESIRREKETGSGEPRGGDHGEEERDEEEGDSEEEESDPDDEESHSEEEESDESDSEEDTEDDEESGREQKKVCIKTSSCPLTIKAGLLNVCSLNKTKNNRKITEEIKKLITENNLDVFLTTETHLKKKGGDKVLQEASPSNFSFLHQVRPLRQTFNVNQERKKRGGGVAVQYKQDLQGERRRIKAAETFEYVAAEMKRVLFINVYRPPGLTKVKIEAFLREFKELFNELSKHTNSIIITGDFNIHVDVAKRTSTKKFKKFLKESDLTQHVKEPTHRGKNKKGHTLDLVITRNVEISDLRVRRDIDISDHYLVTFNVRPVLEDANEKTKEKDDEEEEEVKQSEL